MSLTMNSRSRALKVVPATTGFNEPFPFMRRAYRSSATFLPNISLLIAMAFSRMPNWFPVSKRPWPRG